MKRIVGLTVHSRVAGTLSPCIAKPCCSSGQVTSVLTTTGPALLVYQADSCQCSLDRRSDCQRYVNVKLIVTVVDLKAK